MTPLLLRATGTPATRAVICPRKKAMKQLSKHSASIDKGDVAPDARREQEARNRRSLTEGGKPVGESDNDGSSPDEEPHHLARQQRDP